MGAPGAARGRRRAPGRVGRGAGERGTLPEGQEATADLRTHNRLCFLCQTITFKGKILEGMTDPSTSNHHHPSIHIKQLFMKLHDADVGENVDRALRSAGRPVARTLAVVAGQGTAQTPLLLALPSEILSF